MQSVEKITQRILGEAQASADKVIADANAAAEKLVADKKAELDAFEEKARNEIAEAAAEQERRSLSTIDLELRRNILLAQRQAIDETFDKALAHLSQLPADKQVETLAKKVVEAAPEGKGELVMAKGASFGSDLIAAASKLYAEAGKKCEITLSNDTVNAAGGFVLRIGSIEYNNTYEALLKACRQELEPEVFDILFEN